MKKNIKTNTKRNSTSSFQGNTKTILRFPVKLLALLLPLQIIIKTQISRQDSSGVKS
jgi:hypothetical protein